MVNVKNAYSRLLHEGWIDYDKTIPKHVLENVLNVRDDKYSPWIFLGPLLELKQYIEVKGYKLTQAGSIDGLRILPARFVQKKIESRKNRNYRQHLRDKECGENVKMDELNPTEQKELNHSLHVLSLLTQAMNSVLKDII